MAAELWLSAAIYRRLEDPYVDAGIDRLHVAIVFDDISPDLITRTINAMIEYGSIVEDENHVLRVAPYEPANNERREQDR